MKTGRTMPSRSDGAAAASGQAAPAAGGLDKSYTPSRAEPDVRARWESSRAFHAQPQRPGEPFCILIPPPNVTAALHLGHAFNNTLQDVLTRYHRMRGFNTLWMPGTDHAGIATQAVVEKRLLLQGTKRTNLTREQFISKVQEWKDEYEATIIEQLKAMGCSCDFERTRFTMDEVCAKAVREAFFRLFKDGLIYRGKRLVNWDPVTQTALADDEVEMEQVQGHMWYLRYPLSEPDRADQHSEPDRADQYNEPDRVDPVSGASGRHAPARFIVVATTRPETMLGDTAVAMNPKDPRAGDFVGRKVKLPIVDRIVPIIADDYVVLPRSLGGDPDDPKSEFATGFLKVTPAHDPNDYEIGQRHNLPIVNVFAPDATISEKHGWDDVSAEARRFIGLSREEARANVVDWFKRHGLLEGVKPYAHSVGHSYRSHAAIEPYLSDQWYVKVTDDRLRGEALRAMAADQREGGGEPDRADPAPPPGRHAPARSAAREGGDELRFFPSRYARTFQAWHENLRDWCISRQLWWGHRIPVWSLHWSNEMLRQRRPGAAPPYANDSDDSVIFDEMQAAFDASSVEVAVQRERTGLGYWVRYCVPPDRDDLEQKLHEGGYIQDPDVLDTWFSSALWPISTMGWPAPEDFPDEIPEGSALLETFNPSSVLLTSREIITLWVSRMVMFNRYFREGKLPFRHVYIHAMIQDGYGQKMSKSLGNGVDPRDIIHSHGADAMRFTLTKIATATQDVRLPVDMICPHAGCGETFQPREITTASGHRVAEPMQTCPRCRRRMVSGYGAASGQAQPDLDVPLARNSSRKFDEGRNFANKLWNAARFAMSNLTASIGDARGPQSVDPGELALVDKWIITRLCRTLHAAEEALAQYQFNAFADAMYGFVWGDFCDWYLEAIKPTVKTNPAQPQVLRTVLNALLRLLHPIMPFVTEALWPHVAGGGSGGAAGLDGITLAPSTLLATAAWPQINRSVEDQAAAARFERVQLLVNAIRTLRAERQVPTRRKIDLAAPREIVDLIAAAGGVVETLAGLGRVAHAEDNGTAPAGAIPLAIEGGQVLLSGLVEEVDVAAERTRLSRLIEQKERAVSSFQSKLSNDGYLSKAPPEKVQETRRMLADAQAELAAAVRALESLARP